MYSDVYTHKNRVLELWVFTLAIYYRKLTIDGLIHIQRGLEDSFIINSYFIQ